ncbi:protein KAKU4 isoform X2 [Ipomoea triloba]|uniref:protein KAKU4 isoform X2 n=1 Tax=Ipomoea triloba TaxID=35885 RepID=UPI00125E5264|nr:protein KAKU4 isoform X2 [Ipomoea triloba]
MATNFYAGARSGGKIVNKRRRKITTPYDRPPPPPLPPPPPPETPNWLTGLVFPATRTIVSGAAKLLSSVFNSDSSSCSSSSSSSGPPDGDCIYEDDNDHDTHSESLKEVKYAGRNAEQDGGMSKSKHLIEQLIMRETFTRIECDRLINLINSRVVDPPTLDYGLGDAIAVGTTGTLDPCSRYVMEAREWLEDKKDDLRSIACFAEGNCGSSSFLTENVEKVDGSPIYLAKSYMKARPPWASPTEHLDIRTPSSKKSKLFEEGTPFHAGDEFVPSSRKRSSLSSGPWNISEEIRRVRSKATDDILRSLPSKKIDLPLLTERKMKQNAVIDSRDSGSLAHLSISSRPALGTGIGQSETRQDAGKSVTVTSNSRALIPQDNDQIEVVGEWPATEPHQPNGPVLASENLDDPQSNNTTGSGFKDISGSEMAHMANGVPSSEARDGGGEPRPMEIDACSGHERSSDGVHMQVKCEFLTEASIELDESF